MRKFLLNLLFMALMVPWVTQTQAQQCEDGAFMCAITVYAYDDWGDGWTGGTLDIYQGDELRGSVSVSGTSEIVSIPVCPDSIRIEWTPGSFAGECSFAILDGNLDTLYNAALGSLTTSITATVAVTCPSCILPENLVTSGITPDAATVTWREMGAAEQWIVEYGTHGFTRGTGTVALVNDSTYTMIGLDANTEYDVYIRALCDVDDTSAANKVSFRTACLPVTTEDLPYIEDFESYPATSDPATAYIDACWTSWSDYTSQYTVYPYVTSTGSGNKGIYMYNSSGRTALVMPLFEAELNTLELSFRMARVNTSSSSPMLIGAMSNPNDFNTFDTIAVIECLLQSTWQDFVIPLSTYEGENKYIAFCTPNDIITGNYLDNITVNLISECSVPVNVVAENVTTTTADITWVSNATDWIIEYGPSGFVPGTGEGTAEAITAPSFSLSDLTPATGYDVWVRTVCGEDTSYYGLCCSFRTQCEETLPIPFTENFDSYGFGSTVRPECWTYQGYNNNASYPNVSGSYHYSGLASLDMYSQLYPTDTTTPWTYLVTPPIDIESYPMNTLQVRFQAYASSLGGSYPGTIIIGVVSDATDVRGSFYPIDTIRMSNASEWEEIEITLNSYPEDGTGRYIAIVSAPIPEAGSTSTYFYNYINVDDVTIELIPDCPRPASISVLNTTATSVTIQWEDLFEDHGEWEVVYDSTGFNINNIEESQTIQTITNITEDTVLVPNLAPGVYYDFYVRAICGGEYSRWRGPVSSAAGTYSMAKTGIDTIYTCGMTIYDDGGAVGTYSNYCNSTLVVFPSSTDSVISISGTYVGETCCDYLKIYDGVGTSGTQYCNIVGTNNNIGPFVSRTGPITIVFTSDVSGTYAGFELHTQCIEQSVHL